MQNNASSGRLGSPELENLRKPVAIGEFREYICHNRSPRGFCAEAMGTRWGIGKSP